MFLVLFNVSGLMILATLFGMYMGSSKGIIDPLAIASWEEFLLLRDHMAEWNTYTYYLGWTMFSVVVVMILMNVLYVWYKSK